MIEMIDEVQRPDQIKRRGLLAWPTVSGAVSGAVSAAVCAAFSLAVLTGCAKPPVVDNWADVALERDPLAPTTIDAAAISRRTRVVVFPTEESPSSRGSNLHLTAAAAVEAALGAGGVEIVDRSAAKKLDDELKLAEMRGSGAYGGPDVADYAVKVVMGVAAWSSEFSPASSFKGKDGKMITIPASHTHSGRSVMTIRIYAVPSLRLVQSLAVEGKHAISNQSFAAPQNQGGALMKAATEGGINGQKGAMFNEFAPKGYVVSRRIKGGESIFRVMLGRDTGAQKCDKVQIFALKENKNPLTKTVTYDEVLRAEGSMTDTIGAGESWVRVKDKKEADQVRMGQIVRVRKAADTREQMTDLFRQLSC